MQLTEGQAAPDFSAPDQHGNTVSLADFKGRKLALYFYPKDDTPGCTAEACDLRDNYEVLQAKGYAIVGVSTDDAKSHLKFAQKFDLPFPLLADTDQQIVNAYGVWGEKSMFGKKYMGTHRVTFVIDADGKIERIISKVDTKNHAAQLLA